VEPVNAHTREQVIRRVGQRWVLLDAAGHELLSDGAPDWFNLDGDARASLVKSNARRTVHRVEFVDRVLYVKQSHGAGAVERVKQWLLGSPARGECRVAAYAAAHSVPAVWFFARASSSAESAILTISPEIAKAATLVDTFTAAAGDSRRCNDLLASAAELISKAHNAAFLHPDNHPGNILVQSNSADQPHCLYADLYGVRIGQRVSEHDAARNLAAINQWFSRRASRTQRLRAFQRYVGLRTPRMSRVAAKRLLKLTLRESIRHAHALYRKRDSRIGGDNAYFTTLPLQDGWRAQVTLRHRPASLAIADPAPPTGRIDVQQFVDSRLHTSAHSSQPALVDHVDTERLCPPSAWSAFWWRIFGSPAQKRYRTAMKIAHRDLPCQSAIASLEHRRGTGFDQAAWIAASLRNAVPILQCLSDPANAKHRRKVLEQAGRLLADTFDRGIVPTGSVISSLALAHTIDGQTQVAWSRLHAQSLCKPVPDSVRPWVMRWVAQELNSNTHIELVGAARALRAYCRRAGLIQQEKDWRSHWRELRTPEVLALK
jgi:hypothetical protein